MSKKKFYIAGTQYENSVCVYNEEAGTLNEAISDVKDMLSDDGDTDLIGYVYELVPVKKFKYVSDIVEVK